MKVRSPASIREGPSTSAAIIGIAQPGAEAQIVSRSTDWVEIIDPASKKTGWIHQSFLAPQEEPAARPVPPEELAALATPESESAADDQMPSITSKPRKHASRHRHRRHTIVLGPFILRFR
jgi:SH3-like domain-containing protein